MYCVLMLSNDVMSVPFVFWFFSYVYCILLVESFIMKVCFHVLCSCVESKVPSSELYCTLS